MALSTCLMNIILINLVLLVPCHFQLLHPNVRLFFFFFWGVFFFWNLFEVYDLILIHFRFSRHRREADVTEVESSGGGGGGLLSRTILRLRGGEGHHAIAECCWYVSLFEVFERCFDPLQALTSGLDLSWFDYIWIVQRFPSYTSVAFAFAVVSFFLFFWVRGEKLSRTNWTINSTYKLKHFLFSFKSFLYRSWGTLLYRDFGWLFWDVLLKKSLVL